MNDQHQGGVVPRPSSHGGGGRGSSRGRGRNNHQSGNGSYMGPSAGPMMQPVMQPQFFAVNPSQPMFAAVPSAQPQAQPYSQGPPPYPGKTRGGRGGGYRGRGGADNNNNNGQGQGGMAPMAANQQPFYDAHGNLIGFGFPQFVVANPGVGMEQSAEDNFDVSNQSSMQPGAPPPYSVGPASGGGSPQGMNGQMGPAGGAPYEAFSETSPDFCKALAKVAKPRPPWSIGCEPTDDINVEIARLEAFLMPSDRDRQETGDVWDALRAAAVDVYPTASPMYTGSNGWSFFPYKGRLHIAIPAVDESPESQQQMTVALFRNGMKVLREFTDSRGLQCSIAVHAATGREVVLRFGKSAEIAAATVHALRQTPMSADVRQAINCLIVLLRQSKIVDDLDANTFCDEAIAVLAMSIVNSYPDRPTAERLVKDFFLTFGFKEHFDTTGLSVHIGGMVKPITKVHTDDTISILDPANQSLNLASGVTSKKLVFTQGTLNYCYHVVSEFAKEKNPQNRRGQSPLSTIVGGEPFWPRAVELAHLNVTPFHEFFLSVKDRAHSEASKLHARKLQPNRGGGGGGGGNGHRKPAGPMKTGGPNGPSM